MGWTLPRDYTVGEIITAAILNSAVRDNFKYLKGTNQIPTISSGLVIDNTDGDEYFKLPLHTTIESTSVLSASTNAAKMVYDGTASRLKYRDSATIQSILNISDVDDIPVDGASTDPISSNWAYDFTHIATSAGDILYAASAGAFARLGIGAAGQYLQTATTGLPAWGTASTEVIRKTADESVSGSIVFQNDDHLVSNFAPSEEAIIEYQIYYSAQANSDIKFDLDLPAGATFKFSGESIRVTSADAVTPGSYLSASGTGITLGAGANVVRLTAWVANGAASGNVTLQWAQSVSVAANTTTVRRGSWLTKTRV